MGVVRSGGWVGSCDGVGGGGSEFFCSLLLDQVLGFVLFSFSCLYFPFLRGLGMGCLWDGV